MTELTCHLIMVHARSGRAEGGLARGGMSLGSMKMCSQPYATIVRVAARLRACSISICFISMRVGSSGSLPAAAQKPHPPKDRGCPEPQTNCCDTCCQRARRPPAARACRCRSRRATLSWAARWWSRATGTRA